jgi:hypothetical protein
MKIASRLHLADRSLAEQGTGLSNASGLKLNPISEVYMQNFGKLIVAAAATLLIPVSNALASALPSKPFTVFTAPDAVSRAVLASPITKIDQGALPGTDASSAIHRNFPQIIEQNFARLDATGVTALLDNLSETELADLAQHYNTANADSGHADRLLPLLATRLDNAHLVRLSRHFGFAPVYSALVNNAPQLATKFSTTANPMDVALPVHTTALNALASTVGATSSRSLSLGGGGLLHPNVNPISQYWNWTPGDVYLDFRTAPVGGLGAFGAIVETGAIYFGGAYLAWGAGQTAGSYINDLMQTYTPSAYETLGGTLDQMWQNFQGATTAISQGQVLSGITTLFGVPSSQSVPMSTSGGDYGSTSNLTTYTNSIGGGVCPKGGCPKVN